MICHIWQAFIICKFFVLILVLFFFNLFQQFLKVFLYISHKFIRLLKLRMKSPDFILWFVSLIFNFKIPFHWFISEEFWVSLIIFFQWEELLFKFYSILFTSFCMVRGQLLLISCLFQVSIEIISLILVKFIKSL